jgi:hypothetical protein
MRASLAAGLLYVLLVFAAGALCGSLRDLVLAPRIGRLPALLVETLPMLAASFLAARWVTARLRVPARTLPRLVMGGAALALLFALEFAGARALRGMSAAEYAAGLTTPFGLVSLLLFLIFAAMPLLLLRSGR